jgi:hypothetical protein
MLVGKGASVSGSEVVSKFYKVLQQHYFVEGKYHKRAKNDIKDPLHQMIF